MQFVKIEDLKAGMRLAKPIYNKNGVLLYDRDTKITVPGIHSIRNFGLIGIYILEPAEPTPPLSQEDIQFERNQTVYMFQLQDIYAQILNRKPLDQLQSLLLSIQKAYGNLDHRVNFNQNLRSSSDFIYKHSISTAIITAMISSRLDFSNTVRETLLCAALLHNIGYLNVPKSILVKGDHLEKGDRDIIQQMLERGIEQLEFYANDFPFFAKALKLIRYFIFSNSQNHTPKEDTEMRVLASILEVATTFDTMTAMRLGCEPESEIAAMQYLKLNPEIYNNQIVDILAQCIHIAPSGASVDLSGGEKGIILTENPDDFMHPLILRYSDNQLYDLSDPDVADKIQIIDIMKTMDNRVKIDEETLKHFIADDRLKKQYAEFRKKNTLAKVLQNNSQQSRVDSLF